MSPENEWEFNYPVSAAILLIGKFGSFVDPYVLIPSGLSFNCLFLQKPGTTEVSACYTCPDISMAMYWRRFVIKSINCHLYLHALCLPQ
jgi:hypothetical protein